LSPISSSSRAGPAGLPSGGQFGPQRVEGDECVVGEGLQPRVEPTPQLVGVQAGEQHLAGGRGVRRAGLAHPGLQRDLGGARGLGDVDDPVLVEDVQVGRFADLGRQRVAGVLAELHQVEVPAA